MIAVPSSAALALVPGLQHGAPPLRLQKLRGGSVNDSWRVDSARGQFVLRVDGPQSRRLGVDRARERWVHDAAAAAALTPAIVVQDDVIGAQVRQFVEGRVWNAADFSDHTQLARLGRQLALLHELSPPAESVPELKPYNPGAYAEDYARRALSIGVAAVGDSQAIARAVSQVHQCAARVAGRACIVHGDLAHGNVLDGATLWLLDWEYAQVADPLYDVACVLAYYPQAWPNAALLLAAAGLNDPPDSPRLAAAVEVYRALTWLWHRARGPVGADILSYNTGVLRCGSAN